MRMSLLRLLCVTILGCSFVSWSVQAELAVIVAKDSPIQSLSYKQLNQIYLGTSRAVAQGIEVMPLVLSSTDPLHHEFNLKITGKDPVEWRHYWSRWLFTGKRVPPGVVLTSGEMIAKVAEDPGVLGYVQASDLTSEVKVVLHLQ